MILMEISKHDSTFCGQWGNRHSPTLLASLAADGHGKRGGHRETPGKEKAEIRAVPLQAREHRLSPVNHERPGSCRKD